MVERVKLEESIIGNIMITTYDSFDPGQADPNGQFETVIFSPSFGRKVLYSTEETEAALNHEKACKFALGQILL